MIVIFVVDKNHGEEDKDESFEFILCAGRDCNE